MIRELKDEVLLALSLDDESRDCDRILITIVWKRQLLDKYHGRPVSAYDLLLNLTNGYLYSPESITRCRRKLQEEMPELRGTRYEERKNKLTKIVKQEIKDGLQKQIKVFP